MTDLIHRRTAWTCFAPTTKVSRCEHLNATGGRKVPHIDYRGRPTTKTVCEACGAEWTSRSSGAQSDWDEADMARRSTVRELVLAFQRAETATRSAFAAIVTAENDVNVAFGAKPGGHRQIWISASGNRHHCNFENVDDAIRIMRRQAWSAIVDRLELRRMMSMAAWKKHEQEAQDAEPLPITEQTVNGFARFVFSRIHTMHEEAVTEVFDWLRPRDVSDRRYATNSLYEIGKRVVLERVVEVAWQRAGGYSVNYHYEQNLTALENVFTALDGNGMINEGHYSLLSAAIKACVGGVGETDYFRFRCFKKGTLHLEFKRTDLVAKLNAIAGGKTLRPTG